MTLYGVIIPTYNEVENVQILCELIKDVFTDMNLHYQIIFVDDGSPDGTANLLEELKQKYPIFLIKRFKKLGIGSAYKLAIETVPNLDFIIIMDSDLSHNPGDIKNFIRKQKQTNCDLVYGTRYNGGTSVNWPFTRRLLSRIANNLSQIVLGVDITDFTNSFRLYRGTMLRALLPIINSTGFSFQMETIYIASEEGFRIEEVPVVFHERIRGKSKIGSTEIFLFIKQLLSLPMKRLSS
ncbi:Dolichol-phosphate mannosyltransferase [Pseudoloma neurophilia]|uniref:Dolichol-phosphate mannosyltransferase subunit 1 n=1 Tax=Pseudoloma neurophilia TaxID=146866 RepID=A0A0R0M827_9MICR|nr:Dolichol-phosphate mannosyltransferase [Pseudoloma neurophilia]